jgi:hypothetical protein
MGDAADYLIEHGFDALAQGDEDFDDFDEDARFGTVDGQHIKTGVTCRYCGATKLHWVNTDSRWRLAGDDGEIHSCVQYVAMPANRDKK